MANKKTRILAIDDNSDNLVVLKALINESFPEALYISADSGRKGFELSQTSKPDVILLDIVMPEMDGYEVCAKIKSDIRLRHIPVIMLTANRTDKEGRVKALEVGAEAFIPKPVDESELKAQIKAMLRIKESEDLKKEEKQRLEDMVLDRTEALEKELADRKRAENKLIQSLDKITKNRQAIMNLMEDLKIEMSERRQVEEKLQIERNLLRTLIDNLPDTIYILDNEGRKVIANREDLKSIGYKTEAEVIGKNDLQLYPGEIGVRGHADNMSVINNAVPIVDREEYFIDEKSTMRWFLTSKYPLYDTNGKVSGLFGTGHDITNRKKAQQDLEEKNRELGFLYTVSHELSQLSLTDNINEFLAKKLKEYTGAVLAVSLDYLADKSALQIKHIETNQAILNKVSKILGSKFFERTTSVEPENLDFILHESYAESNSLKELSFGQISELTDKTVKSVAGIDRYCAIASVFGDEYFGTTMLGFKKGTLTPRKELLVSFARVASATIKRRQYEQKLKESEEQYRLLIQNQGEGVGIVNLKEEFIYANPAAEEMFGLGKGGLMHRSLMEFVDPDHLSIIKNETKKRSKAEKSTYEIGIIHPNGGRHTILVTATPQFTVDGKLSGTFGVFRDITERKNAEIELRKKQEFIETILENSPIGFAVNRIDDGSIIYVGSKFEEIYGVENGRLRSVSEFFEIVYLDPEVRGKMRERTITDIMSGDPSRMRWEDIEIVTRSGEKRFVTAINIPLYEQNLMISTVQDVTLRKQMEQRILESEAYYRTLIDISPDGIIIADLEGKVYYGSIKAYEMFGVPPGVNITGSSLLRWISADFQQSVMERVSDIINGNVAPETREFRLQKYDGTIFWGELSSSPLSDSEGHPVSLMIVCRDITDRKRAETELILSKEKAEESDRLKTAFLHNISHEIRTPMNAIIGFSALLAEPDLDKESQSYYTEIITRSSNNLLSIVNDIIEISNIEAGILKINSRHTRLNDLMKRIHNQYMANATEKSIGLKLLITDLESDLSVDVDDSKVAHVISSLLSNAFKFTEKGKISFGYTMKNNKIEFFVSDTGIGISEDQHKRIFERFYQIENSTTRMYEGTGLGLPISKAYVELLGGEIWLESQLGKGSTFFFSIPFAPGEHTGAPEAKTVKEMNTKLQGQKTILIAEDEENNFRLMKAVLANLNLNIIHAVNGKEAVDICKSGVRIDLIVMDIKMPVMDGYEATGIIKKIMPSVPVIAQTAFAFESDRTKALDAGCDEYISKPVKKDLLIEMVKKYL